MISDRSTLPDIYAKAMLTEGVVTDAELADCVQSHTDLCNEHFKMVDSYQPKDECLKAKWDGIRQAPKALTQWDTGLPVDLLKYIGGQSVKHPEEFNLHPHLGKIHVNARLKRLEEGAAIDWGLAEALAVGSLLYQVYDNT